MKKKIKDILFSYSRILFTIIVSLYTTRLSLNILGIVNFGIYILLNSLILTLSFINLATITSSQRFFSYYHHNNEFEIKKKLFASSFLLHLIISLFVVLFIEVFGEYIIINFFNIIKEKQKIAFVVLRLMGLVSFFSFIASPYIALLNTNENFSFIFTVNIAESLLKCVAITLLASLDGDKLILWGILSVIISFIIFLIYFILCLSKFKECNIKLFENSDRSMIKSIVFFTGWNFFGAMCSVSKVQGLSMILNYFFGATINSAYGISTQMVGQINIVSNSFLQLINPKISKSAGLGDLNNLFKLVVQSSKFSYFLVTMISVPTIIEISDILELWLGQSIDNASLFSRLAIVTIIINQMTVGVQSGLQAIGNIKKYQVVVGIVVLLNLPISFLFLANKFQPHSVLIAGTTLEVVACFLRVYFLKLEGVCSFKEYFEQVIVKLIIPTIVVVAISILCDEFIKIKYGFILTFFMSVVFFIIFVYKYGLEDYEKKEINSFLKYKIIM